MRKVAFFITGLNVGGAELAMLKLVSEIKDPTIVFSLKAGGKLKSKFKNVDTQVIDLDLSVKNCVKNLQLVLKKLDENEIEIICSSLYHADFFACFLKFVRPKLKLIWTIHNLSIGKHSVKLTTRIVAHINSVMSYIFPSKIIYCASSAKTYHEKALHFNNRIGIIINNPIFENDLVSPSMQAISKGTIDFKVGMAARWDPVKNHRLAFEAFYRLSLEQKNTELILCGTNMNWNNSELVDLLNKFQIAEKVKLLDTLDDMETFYDLIDALLITSLSEALPNVVIEALLHEKPVISVPVGDIPNIIRNLDTLVDYDATVIAEKILFIEKNYNNFLLNLKFFKKEGYLDQYKSKHVYTKYCEVFDAI